MSRVTIHVSIVCITAIVFFDSIVEGGSAASPPTRPLRIAHISSIDFSPDGKQLAVAEYNEILLINPDNGAVTSRIHAGKVTLNAIAFSPTGEWLAAAGGTPSRSGEIQIWNVRDRKQMQSEQRHKDMIHGIAFDRSGARLAACSYDRTITLWSFNARDGKLVEAKTLVDHTDAVYGVAFNRDGSWLASASGDRTVKIWDAASGKRLFTLSDATAELYTVSFSADGSKVAAAGVDKALRVWSVSGQGGILQQSAFAHDGAIIRLLIGSNQQRIITCGEDRLIKIWDANLVERHVFERQSDWPFAIALSPEGNRLSVGRYDGSLTLYDLNSFMARWTVHPVPGGLK